MRQDNDILKKSIDIKGLNERCWTLVFNHARIDATIRLVRCRVVGFSLNLSVLEGDKMVDVARWDTSHGYLHKHEFWKTHRTIKDKRFAGKELADAFNELYAELKNNWGRYVESWKTSRSA